MVLIKSVFDPVEVDEILDRIDQLTPHTRGLWGQMNAAQMLAHLNVAYEMIYTDQHPRPGLFKSIILKYIVKPYVVSDKIYPKNTKTAPQFKITKAKDFEKEKKRLIDYIQKTLALGADYFDGMPSHSFGVLSKEEWNAMLYKHLDHHLRQFGC